MLSKYINSKQAQNFFNKDHRRNKQLHILIYLLLHKYWHITRLLKKNTYFQYVYERPVTFRNVWFDSQNQYVSFTKFLAKKQNKISLAIFNDWRRTKTYKKIKLSKIQWKITKKYLNRLKKYNKPKKILTNFFKKLTTTNVTKKINNRSLKKRTSSIYRTKKKFNLLNYKLRYNRWIKNATKKLHYTSLYKKFSNRDRVVSKFYVVSLLTKMRAKKTSINFLKRKLLTKQNHRVRFYKPLMVSKILNVNCTSLKKGRVFIKNYYIYKNPKNKLNIFMNGSIHAQIAINNVHPRKPTLTQLTSIKQTLLSTSSLKTIVSSKQALKQRAFKTLFENSSDYTYNTNRTPINYFFDTPQLFLKMFGYTRNNINDHHDVNLFFEQFEQKTDGQLTTHPITQALKNNKITGRISNYSPLFLFSHSLNNRSAQQLTYVKTQNYYYNVNVLATTKYKTFFIFFLLNFLENMLQKKIWIRINTQDPIDLFYKNYILFFLKKYNHLYKKFNKLISVRELLEILWISFKNHDLIILLTFLKKKIESAHFKKHKKILSIFFDILRKNEHLFKSLDIKGFFFDIRGKVGVSGNAKKRHHSFSMGKITTTSQNLGSYFQQMNIWTPTGQMGVTCILQY